MNRSIDEINRLIRGVTPRNNGAIQLKKAWIVWYNKLGWYERSLDAMTHKNAVDRLTAFETVNGGPSFGAEAERRTLRLGSTGPAVAMWQKAIGIAVTGTFDTPTRLATIAYQKSKGLSADGVVGNATWETIPSESALTRVPVKKIAGGVAAAAIGIGAAVYADKKFLRKRR